MSGVAFKEAGPKVKYQKLKDTIMFGIQPNGNNAISFLEGEVVEADSDTGRVTYSGTWTGTAPLRSTAGS